MGVLVLKDREVELCVEMVDLLVLKKASLMLDVDVLVAMTKQNFGPQVRLKLWRGKSRGNRGVIQKNLWSMYSRNLDVNL